MPLDHEVTDELRAKEEQKVRDAYANLFIGADAEIVLDDLEKFCRLFKPSFVPGEIDLTGYREGKRAVGMRIFILSGVLGRMKKAKGV
jgi:hypothetical protein